MRVPSNEVTASSRADAAGAKNAASATATITETTQLTDLPLITFPLATMSL